MLTFTHKKTKRKYTLISSNADGVTLENNETKERGDLSYQRIKEIFTIGRGEIPTESWLNFIETFQIKRDDNNQ